MTRNKKMTKETTEQGRVYNQIYSGVQRLSLEVEGTRHPRGFDQYIIMVNSLQRKYIGGFDGMNNAERQNASLLINMVLNQIHGRLDIIRARAMREELRRKE